MVSMSMVTELKGLSEAMVRALSMGLFHSCGTEFMTSDSLARCADIVVSLPFSLSRFLTNRGHSCWSSGQVTCCCCESSHLGALGTLGGGVRGLLLSRELTNM